MSSSTTQPRRVVITGLGIVSPLGIGVESFGNNLTAGKSGIGPITLFPTSELPGHIGGQVWEYTKDTAKNYIRQRKNIRLMCRDIQLGVASATLALEDAGIADGALNPERIGVEFGANLMLSPPGVLADAVFACADDERVFHHPKWGTAGLSNMEPLWLLQYLPNMPACHIAIFHDTRGPSNSLTLAEASGNTVISEAFHILTRGSADVMITGATGTTLHPVQSIHAVLWDKLAELDGDPAKMARPFDRNRTGTVVSEGAVTAILEDAEHAAARGAKVYGTVLGVGSCCITERVGHGDFRAAAAQAMRRALEHAGLQPGDIGHINAHGLGNPEIDVLEAQAIHDVFGDKAASVPVTAFKSYWGNPGASCGMLELAGSLLGLQHGVVLPTLNFETPDPAVRLNVVHGQPLPVTNKVFLSLNFTRLGQAAAAVIQGA